MIDIADVQARLDSLYEELFDVIMLDEWTAFTHDEQVALREAMNTGYSVFGIVFRQAFDSAVWAGWKTGKVLPSVESLRAQRKNDEDAPKVAPTKADILAKAKNRR
jgi:hypothetical protein